MHVVRFIKKITTSANCIDIDDISPAGGGNNFDHVIMTKDSTKSLYESMNEVNYDNS